MNFKAQSTFTPGNLAAIEALLVPRLIAAVGNAANTVADEARTLAPVDTGELRDSIGTTVAWEGQQVTGSIQATSPHAAFNEFGTGIRGAESAGAGDVSYDPAWPGMPATPFMRPALDISHAAIVEAFGEQKF